MKVLRTRRFLRGGRTPTECRMTKNLRATFGRYFTGLDYLLWSSYPQTWTLHREDPRDSLMVHWETDS